MTLNATVTLCDNICYIQVLLSTEPNYIHCNASQSNSPTDCPPGEGGGFNTQIKQKLTSRHLPSERHSPKDTYLQTDTHLQTITFRQILTCRHLPKYRTDRQTHISSLAGRLSVWGHLKSWNFTFSHLTTWWPLVDEGTWMFCKQNHLFLNLTFSLDRISPHTHYWRFLREKRSTKFRQKTEICGKR